jgi:hypothetical protein
MGKVGDGTMTDGVLSLIDGCSLGGWNVCITNLSSDSIVYSFGIDKVRLCYVYYYYYYYVYVYLLYLCCLSRGM